MSKTKHQVPATPAGSEEFAALLDQAGAIASLRLAVGDRVSGRVIHISNDTVFCALSPTQEASIPKTELLADDGKLSVTIGDEVEAFVYSLRNGIELRRRLSSDGVDLLLLERARETRLPVQGTITGVNKGGLEIAVAGTRGFCPISQIDVDFVEDPQALVGKTYDFLVQEVRESGRNVVLNRRQLLEAERQEKAKALLADLAVGQRRLVTITRLTSFGAFADLGGVDGLIPLSELGHGSIEAADAVVHPGDKVEVEVLRIEEDPKRKGQSRIALSLRAALPDPFVVHAADLVEGAVREGKVVRIQKFGAFVELFPGVDGLVHISEMSERRIRHPKDVVSEGQRVTVRILQVQPEERRIALTMKEMAERPAAGQGPVVGARVDGIVDRVERFGVFVKLGGGHRALLPAAETGTPPGSDLTKQFPEGTSLPLIVIAVDEQGRIKVSKTARERDEERSMVDDYNRAQGGGKGLGTLGDLLKSKKR